ncbi:Uncharacterised protein [Mycobacteroides abscessus subsp. abscessus]|nr:Uncharacterised protein [Mycobacteroides abscessus subsp. abscessus]
MAELPAPTATTTARTIIQMKPSTMPAMAMPRPFWPVRLI